ncbi:hypothetical protein [Enterococcus caccae]|uniref:Uncharacterized protein n=1 Tax=Enterococcus caccae ATCC BAA-1240 TaxID=1158612 RepID=R3TXV7_9ENTE|nr:hypothetical protein [Enterococcus caccae]EOL45953.1 hypothetical protein UC7_01750 [Enterococcus caccae ATCC BAA-1240]EOT61149.1 hypothetical protein I580_02051 [Enterococcus caccae ATCC BAA-1240]OJG27820.1 hypothetical protein RU98_GL002029 [Enterococcus caccae]
MKTGMKFLICVIRCTNLLFASIRSYSTVRFLNGKKIALSPVNNNYFGNQQNNYNKITLTPISVNKHEVDANDEHLNTTILSDFLVTLTQKFFTGKSLSVPVKGIWTFNDCTNVNSTFKIDQKQTEKIIHDFLDNGAKQ